jgi:hypothetical protein
MVSSGLLRRVVLTRATRRNNPEDTILHSHRRENLKSYIFRNVVVKSQELSDSVVICIAIVVHGRMQQQSSNVTLSMNFKVKLALRRLQKRLNHGQERAMQP